MYSTINCPGCSVRIKAPNAKIGTIGTCPKCKQRIAIQLPSEESAPQPEKNPKSEIEPVAHNEELKFYKECPFCAETILYKAKVCKHCRYSLDSTNRNEQPSRNTNRDKNESKVVVNNVINPSYFDHTLHIVLDIFTCGGWIPIHLLCYILYHFGGTIAWILAIGVVVVFGMIGFFVAMAIIGSFNKPAASLQTQNKQVSDKVKNDTSEYAVAIKESITINGVKVHIKSATIDKLESKGWLEDSYKKTAESYLILTYEVSASDATKKIDAIDIYSSFRGDAKDNYGNTYGQSASQYKYNEYFTGNYHKNDVVKNKPAIGILAFEAPLESAEFITFVISGDLAKSEQPFRFKINRSSWAKKEEPKKTESKAGAGGVGGANPFNP
jgi:hypothetical protein